MKKSQPLLKSQPAKVKSQYSINNHTLKVCKKPLNKLQTYEILRAEFIKSNPGCNDVEIITACISFAKQSGLTLSRKLLEINLYKLGVNHVD